MRAVVGVGLLAVLVQAGPGPKEPLSINFSAEDIEGAAIAVKLTPSAAKKLEAITRDHVGQVLSVTIDDVPAFRSTIEGTIDSGFMQLPMSAKLAKVLEKSGASRGKQHGGYRK